MEKGNVTEEQKKQLCNSNQNHNPEFAVVTVAVATAFVSCAVPCLLQLRLRAV